MDQDRNEQVRVAVVTGAASGIGRAVAVRCAREGVRTVIDYPGDPHDPEETLRLVEAAGGEGIVVDVDVRDSSQVDDLRLRAYETFRADRPGRGECGDPPPRGPVRLR